MSLPKIYYCVDKLKDWFSGGVVEIDGWRYEGGCGLFDSFTSALAHSMGLWDEYCDYHRNKNTEKDYGRKTT